MKKLILLLLLFCSATAYATISTVPYGVKATFGLTGLVGYGSSLQQAGMSYAQQECQAKADSYSATLTSVVWDAGGAKPICFYTLPSGSSSNQYATVSYVYGSFQGCPVNSTLSGSSCVCNSGYIEEGGQCVPPPADPCEATQGLTTGYSAWDVVFKNVNVTSSALGSFIGQSVKASVPINGNNCAATGTVKFCAVFGTDLVCTLEGTTYTGATFSGEQTLFGLPEASPDAIAQDDLQKVCPTGQYPGEVNGTQVCVKSNGSANTTQSTTTNPDGTSTTTTTTTSCVGDECTSTTTTETKDAEGNSTGSGTSTTQGDKDAFCTANPTAPECKNTASSFGGTCDSGFTCQSDDPLQCAIALDQYKTNCEILKRDENLGQNLADLIDAPLTDLDLDTVSIVAPTAPSHTCSITPFTIPVGMGTFMVDLTHMCAYLNTIQNIVVAFGMVMWTLIVFVRQ
jgi:hypothetical protein